jgi:hypothetical protein
MSSQGIRYWLEWKPPIIKNCPKGEPSKPSKPGFEGFVGTVLGENSKIAPCPTGEEQNRIDAAMDLLNDCGARILPGPCVAVPAGRLTPEVRAAIKALRLDNLSLVLLPEVAE